MFGLEDLTVRQLYTLSRLISDGLYTNEQGYINIDDLINPYLTVDEILKTVSKRLNGKNEKIVPIKVPEDNMKYINEIKKLGIDVSDLINPYFSLEQLKFLVEFKKQGIDISSICNPLLSIEDMSTLINYILSHGETDIYNEIRYIDTWLLLVVLSAAKKNDDVATLLQVAKSNREEFIEKIKSYTDNNSYVDKIPTHSNFVKVYTQNRYKKNK